MRTDAAEHLRIAAAHAAAPTPTSEVQKVPPEQALAVLGHMVADPEGKDIGRLVDVLVDREGQPQAAVIDFGGFLGVGSRKIAVRWNMLHFVPGRSEASGDARPDTRSDQGGARIQGCHPAGARRCRAPSAEMTHATRRNITARGPRALDLLNFFVADVQTGFGPFVAVYLTTHKWTQVEIGFALTLGTTVALISQIPAGMLIDAVHNKRVAAGVALIGVIIAALLLAIQPTVLPVLVAQSLHAFSSCMLTPAIAAISLHLVGHTGLGERLGRNARFAAIGNGLAAGVMGATGAYLSSRAVFVLTAVHSASLR